MYTTNDVKSFLVLLKCIYYMIEYTSENTDNDDDVNVVDTVSSHLTENKRSRFGVFGRNETKNGHNYLTFHTIIIS